MKRTNVYLDEEQSRTLRHLAIEENRSFTGLVREALNEYLTRRGLQAQSTVAGPLRSIADDDWKARFDAVLSRIRSGVPSEDSPAEIEAAITAARAEVRRSRKAGKQARGG